MKQPCRFHVEVKVFFVESKTRFAKKGKPVVMRIEQRKLFLIDPNATGSDSGDYRIVVKKGKYTISRIPLIPQTIWNNPSGKVEMWYKKPANIEYDDGTIERPFKRTDDPATDEDGILRWLTFKMGSLQHARIALETLLTQKPDNLKMAA